MTLLRFETQDGGPVVVDSASIVAIGRSGVDAVIYTAGWRFQVNEDFDTALGHWQEARDLAALVADRQMLTAPTAQAAHPGVYPLVVHQHPELLP